MMTDNDLLEVDTRLTRIVRTHCFRVEDREDIKQVVLMRIWRNPPVLQTATLHTYLTWAVINQVHDLHRKQRVRKQEPLTDKLVQVLAAPEAPRTHEHLESLNGWVSLLHPKYRSVVLLRLQGMTFREIAKELSASETAVKIRFCRALKILRASASRM